MRQHTSDAQRDKRSRKGSGYPNPGQFAAARRADDPSADIAPVSAVHNLSTESIHASAAEAGVPVEGRPLREILHDVALAQAQHASGVSLPLLRKAAGVSGSPMQKSAALIAGGANTEAAIVASLSHS